MSEQPPPAPQVPPSGPVQDRPTQGWAPPPLAGPDRASLASRNPADATTPDAAPRGDVIDQYAPRRSLVPVLAAVVGIVAAAAIVYTANRPAPAPVATPSHSATAKPTPRAGKQFTADRSHATGVWQITDSRWTPGGLDVLIEVTLDAGALTPSFDAMPNSGSGYVKGEPSARTPAFDGNAIRPGTTTRGWMFFATSRETTLIFLGDAYDPQISGIEVPG
jgi:hypothetical protein